MPTIYGDNNKNIADGDINQTVLTAEAVFAFFFCLCFLKKAPTDYDIVSVSEDKRVLRHLSWIRMALFSCFIFLAFLCVSVGKVIGFGDAGMAAMYSVFVICYVLAFSVFIFRKRTNLVLLKYLY